MRLKKAELKGDKLTVQIDASDIDSRAEAQKWINGFQPGNFEIVKKKKKRSLDANAYCWVLCQMIADARKLTKEEVYRNAIREGNQFTPLTVKKEAYPELKRVWEERGIGWIAEIVDESEESYTVLAYYGSSIYDTKEMAWLIDRLVQDAKSLDLDVLTESERALLLQEWNNGQKKVH